MTEQCCVLIQAHFEKCSGEKVEGAGVIGPFPTNEDAKEMIRHFLGGERGITAFSPWVVSRNIPFSQPHKDSKFTHWTAKLIAYATFPY
jgi:hypothetical protein